MQRPRCVPRPRTQSLSRTRLLQRRFRHYQHTIIPGWEGATLGIGFQFFNVLNHPNFGFPINESSEPYFGQIVYLEQPPTSILGANLGGDVSPRMIQLKAEVQF